MKNFVWFFAALSLLGTPATAQFNFDGGCSAGVYSNGLINPNLIRATFRFNTSSGGCTGCLVNQLVGGKPRQYFITARHCIRAGNYGGGPLIDFNNVTFIFNFQSRNGDQNAIPDIAPTTLGNRGEYPRFRYAFTSPVTLQYESAGVFGTGLGIDIAMLEIVRPIPPHFNVFYAGWKTDGLLGPGGVINAPMTVVHHPLSDAKKYAKTFYIAKTENSVATSCRTITRVIDSIIRFFGGKSNTETICSYADVPQYVVPVMTAGAISHGSSGSPFFTNGDRLFAVTSTALPPDNNCINIGPTFGKFRSAYADRRVKEPLNPNYAISANLFGINGRGIGCYPENPLRLSGNYFPARDYQPDAQQVIGAERNIVAGAIPGSPNTYARVNVAGAIDPPNPFGNTLEEGFLRIYAGADFVFTAGESIRLVDGFEVQPGASFTARIQSCNTSNRLSSMVDALPEPVLPPLLLMEEKEDQLQLTPNPATGAVRCRYTLTQPGAVRISVFNMNGQEVQPLFESPGQPVGSYDVPGNVADLPAGNYIVQLKTGTVSKSAHLAVSH